MLKSLDNPINLLTHDSFIATYIHNYFDSDFDDLGPRLTSNAWWRTSIYMSLLEPDINFCLDD